MRNMVLKESLVICALARDCVQALGKNIPRIEELRRHFVSSEVIVIENDSIDGTKELLADWSSKSPGVNVQSDDQFIVTLREKDHTNPNPGTSLHRIQKMADYRNKYISWIEASEKSFDYVLMIDIDVEFFVVEGIIRSIVDAPKNWGGIFAYGFTDSKLFNWRGYKIYHDLYAFVEKRPTNLPRITYSDMFKNSKRINGLLKPHRFFPVASAFGGLGIYKYEAIREIKYECARNNDEIIEALCEHIPFNVSVIDRGYQNYISTDMQVYYGDSNRLMVIRNLLPLKLFKALAFLISFKKLKA